MIKGKDKPFTKGKHYVFPTFTKENSKGKFCELCGRWRPLKEFTQNSKKCIKCKE